VGRGDVEVMLAPGRYDARHWSQAQDLSLPRLSDLAWRVQHQLLVLEPDDSHAGVEVAAIVRDGVFCHPNRARDNTSQRIMMTATQCQLWSDVAGQHVLLCGKTQLRGRGERSVCQCNCKRLSLLWMCVVAVERHTVQTVGNM
jgi:hypothetical protein